MVPSKQALEYVVKHFVGIKYRLMQIKEILSLIQRARFTTLRVKTCAEKAFCHVTLQLICPELTTTYSWPGMYIKS